MMTQEGRDHCICTHFHFFGESILMLGALGSATEVVWFFTGMYRVSGLCFIRRVLNRCVLIDVVARFFD